MASGNHPDAVPASHLNNLENSLQNPEQQVLKIAPSESNFLILDANQATETVASWSLTTPSAKTLLSRAMYISWQCKVMITNKEQNEHLQTTPDFPRHFAPVSNPLAKIVESCRVSINGRSDSVESSLVTKVTEYMAPNGRLVRSSEPRQPVRGSSVGAIPNNHAMKDYYFGNYDGVSNFTKFSRGEVADMEVESHANSSNQWYGVNHGMTVANAGNRGSRYAIFEFVSPVPFDLFTNSEEEALVNVNEIQINLKFHQNIMGRLFAWKGDVPSFADMTCQISQRSNDDGLHDMKLLYKTVTSASESSIPNSMTTMYTSYRVQREQFLKELAPDDGRSDTGRLQGWHHASDKFTAGKERVIMKSVRLPQIPNRIFLFATQPQSALDAFQRPSNTPQIMQDGDTPQTGAEGDNKEPFYTTLPANDDGDRVEFKIQDEFVAKMQSGEYKFVGFGGNGWEIIPMQGETTWNNVYRFCRREISETVADYFGQNTAFGGEKIPHNDGTLNKKIGFLTGPQDPQEAKGHSLGYGNEIPALKISDVRITLNNKHNLLMVPDGESDKYYYQMCAKNGLNVSFQEFKKGGPIVIDLGDDIGARGLVTGSTGIFDCAIQFNVENYVQENAFVRGKDDYDYYGEHPVVALEKGFTAYAMFEYVTALTIQPETAMMNIGVPIDEVARSVNNVVDADDGADTSQLSGSGLGKLKRRGLRKIRKVGRFVAHAAREVERGIDTAQKGVDEARRLRDKVGAAHSAMKGSGGIGLYG